MANEKRLIDANALIAEYDRVHIGEPGKARKLIEDAPSVEAVEIVRCRDCKYYYDYGVNRDYCCNRSKYGKQVFDVKFKADDFCSYGERKDGGGNS